MPVDTATATRILPAGTAPTPMFNESAELYDLIYSSFKNYEAETEALAGILRSANPACRTVLDVACGTGEHARLLGERYGFEVDGIDLEPGFVRIASRKNPSGRFTVDDMTRFDLGRRYDAVICLFSAIGYVRTLDGLRDALRCFRAHVNPSGVIVVEPWFTPGVLDDGHESSAVTEANDIRVARRSRTEIDGRISRLHFDYDVTDHGRSYQTSEIHELGLFTVDETRAAFEDQDMSVDFDAKGLIGRGLYVARPRESARSLLS